MSAVTFEHIGYSKDYYFNGKYIGCINVDESDRGTNYGFSGRKTEVLTEALKLNNKKTLPKGAKVITELIPLCGKSSKNFFGSLMPQRKSRVERNAESKK